MLSQPEADRAVRRIATAAADHRAAVAALLADRSMAIFARCDDPTVAVFDLDLFGAGPQLGRPGYEYEPAAVVHASRRMVRDPASGLWAVEVAGGALHSAADVLQGRPGGLTAEILG